MSNFINTTGYLNDSPHKNNPFNIIKSKVITMNNVDIPLLLRPNKGKSVIAMPNSGEYNFPKADYVFEKPLFQPGGAFNDCPEGFTWSVADQQCLPIDQAQASNFSGNRNSFITGAINPSGQRVGGVGAQTINQGNTTIDENQNAKLKRVFGTPNIPAIAASNLLGYGLATFANNMEQGRQKAFMMKQMNNPLFNGSYSNAQNDYGTDSYEQTGQLRQFQKGGSFNPIEYLYGDDDKEQPKKQEEVVAKKKRITEEDIDTSGEELKMLGLSEEDILNMVRPERIRKQNYQFDSGVSTPSNVNPLVLKTQKDIFNQFSGVTNLGIWGDKSHQQRKSDHNSGDAQDFGIKDIESGNAIANKLIAEAKERGVKYIVFNKKIWNPSISNEWRPYKGSNPHKTHVHVSYNKDLKMYEQGGEYVVDFATMKELQSKGIKFKIL